MNVRALVLFCLWIASPACVAAAAQTTIGTLDVPALAQAPALDPHAPDSAWNGAARVDMRWDVTNQRVASEPSYAFIAISGGDLYVRFDVTQRESLLAQQHANNIGDGTDDEVWIDLWPDGPAGFFYQFAATSNGTHFQYSSENTAYAPTWQSYGTVHAGGFTVTMRIPMRVIKGNGSQRFDAQFVRVIRSTGERQIWSYSPAQTNGDDVNYAGALRGLHAAKRGVPQPRFGLYGLTALGAPRSGLSTSRAGADLSIPVTQTAAFYASLHPDFSNVEVDQSTISPTAFARQYAEVRPFFTQGASYYNNFDCDACVAVSELYTPAIPTPRDGYAFEGREGRVRLAAFDAVGAGRSDAAQSLGIASPNNFWGFSAQRVAADSPFWHDDLTMAGLHFNNSKNLDAFFNYGSDSGSNVAAGNQAQRYDGGAYYYTNTFGAAFSARKIGYYYNPVDGYVQHPDVAGYAAYLNKIVLFGAKSPLNSLGLSGFIDRYHNAAGVLDQTDSNLTFDVLTRSRLDVAIFTGSDYVLANNCATSIGNLIPVTPLNYAQYSSCQVMTPVTQNGFQLTWHSGTVNSPGNFPNHGPSSTPTYIAYNTGPFGPGRVDTWFRSTTMRAGMRATLSLEADDTRQYLFSGRTFIQWLQRAAYTYTIGPDESVAFGVRRITGTAPYIVTNAPATCVSVVNYSLPQPVCTGAWNVSFAYHRRTPHDEYYFAYGDASRLSTVPQWILKWVHYVGAEKGT